ncbi:hypothetical protein J3A83DRAFT_2932828 [Scleroderma citrinum]
MLTAGSLSSVSPATFTRKPAIKRRRLNATGSTPHVEPATITGKALIASGNLSGAGDGGHLNFTIGSKLSCSSCHRALSSAVHPGAGPVVTCTRCAAPMCTVCSRTCSTIQLAFPLTPPLTRSPTPSLVHGNPQTNSGYASPKRTALGSSSFVMNCDPATALSVKRKRPLIEKDGADISVKPCDQQSSSPYDIIDDITSVLLPGCGRTICRACCVESVADHGTCCMDCYTLV